MFSRDAERSAERGTPPHTPHPTPLHLYTSTPLHLYTSTPLHLYTASRKGALRYEFVVCIGIGGTNFPATNSLRRG